MASCWVSGERQRACCGHTPVRATTWASMGVRWPRSLPRLIAVTPTMTRAASVVVANCRWQRWAEAAVAHLHDAGVGVGRRDPHRGVLGAAALLGRLDLGDLRQRRLDAGEPIGGAAAPRGGRRSTLADARVAAARVTASRWARASCIKVASVAVRRNDDAPALARTRVPSCATLCRST